MNYIIFCEQSELIERSELIEYSNQINKPLILFIMKIIAYYNQFGYEVTDADTQEVLYKSGNHLLDSDTIIYKRTQKNAYFMLPIDRIKQLAEHTAGFMANELGAEFLGSEYDKDQEKAILELI